MIDDLKKKEIKNRAVSATKWSFFAQYIPVITSLISQIFLARLLVPSDYGIVGFCTSIIALSTIFQGGRGIALALIQDADESSKVFNCALTLNCIIGLAIYALLVVLSPLAAQYARDQRTVQVIWVQGFSIIFSSVSSVYIGKLQKEFGFKKITFLTSAGFLSPLVVAIPLAVLGYGYWALVFSSLAGGLASLIFLFSYCHWKPRFCFHKETIKRLVRFSKWVIAEDIIAWLINNADTFLIVRFMSMNDVGIYVFAKKIVSIGVGNLVTPITPILYSTFCKLNTSRETLIGAFRNANWLIAAIALPVTCGLALVVPAALPIIFGTKWISAGIIVSLFSLSEISYIEMPSSQVFSSLGRPSLNTLLMFIGSLYILAGYLICARYGLFWFVFVRLTGLIFVPVWVLTSSRLLKISPSFFLDSIKNPAIATIFMSAVVGGGLLLYSHISISLPFRVVLLALLISLGAASYLIMLMKIDKSRLNSMVRLLKEGIKR